MDFSLFLRLGWDHILEGYDHILFLIVLLAPLRNVKDVLFTVSAFTLTHSIAMIAVISGAIDLNPVFVEATIAITISMTALQNILVEDSKTQTILAAVFGLVHGAGFSSYLQSLVVSTEFVNDLPQIFLGFLAGLELGQVFIAILIYLIVKLLDEYGVYHRIAVEIFRMIAAVGLFLFVSRIFEL